MFADGEKGSRTLGDEGKEGGKKKTSFLFPSLRVQCFY